MIFISLKVLPTVGGHETVGVLLTKGF